MSHVPGEGGPFRPHLLNGGQASSLEKLQLQNLWEQDMGLLGHGYQDTGSTHLLHGGDEAAFLVPPEDELQHDFEKWVLDSVVVMFPWN